MLDPHWAGFSASPGVDSLVFQYTLFLHGRRRGRSGLRRSEHRQVSGRTGIDACGWCVPRPYPKGCAVLGVTLVLLRLHPAFPWKASQLSVEKRLCLVFKKWVSRRTTLYFF